MKLLSWQYRYVHTGCHLRTFSKSACPYSRFRKVLHVSDIRVDSFIEGNLHTFPPVFFAAPSIFSERIQQLLNKQTNSWPNAITTAPVNVARSSPVFPFSPLLLLHLQWLKCYFEISVHMNKFPHRFFAIHSSKTPYHVHPILPAKRIYGFLLLK